jgi:hypothetical protein
MPYIALGTFLVRAVVRAERWCFKMCRTMALFNAIIIGDEMAVLSWVYLGCSGVSEVPRGDGVDLNRRFGISF